MPDGALDERWTGGGGSQWAPETPIYEQQPEAENIAEPHSVEREHPDTSERRERRSA